MDSYKNIVVFLGAIAVLTILPQLILNFLEETFEGNRTFKIIQRTTWLIRVGAIVGIIATTGFYIYKKTNTNSDEVYIATLKECIFPGTTDTVKNVFDGFYGNQKWSVETSVEDADKRKYIIMDGQCYQEAYMIKETGLVNVELVYTAKAVTDKRYEFKLHSGSVDGRSLDEDELGSLYEDTYVGKLDNTKIFSEGFGAGLSNYADALVESMNKSLFTGKYISYYSEAANTESQGSTIEVTAEAKANTPVERSTQETSQEEQTVENTEENVLEENVSDSNEYILSWSSEGWVELKSLDGMSYDTARIALNEIYARHGRKFKDEQLQNYFNNKSWYTGTIEPDQFNEDSLSEIEKENVKTIKEYMNGIKPQ